MPQFYPILDTPRSLTFNVGGLASDSALLTGYQSGVLTCDWDDFLINLWVKAGASGLTAGRQVQLYAIASRDTTGTYPSPITGTAGSGAVWTSSDLLNSGARLVWSAGTSATGGQVYTSTSVSLKRALDVLVLPPKVVFWLAHSMGAALDSTNSNHGLTATPASTEIR